MFGVKPSIFLNLEAACLARGAYEKEESVQWVFMKKIYVNRLCYLPVREYDIEQALKERWEHLTTASPDNA